MSESADLTPSFFIFCWVSLIVMVLEVSLADKAGGKTVESAAKFVSWDVISEYAVEISLCGVIIVAPKIPLLPIFHKIKIDIIKSVHLFNKKKIKNL